MERIRAKFEGMLDEGRQNVIAKGPYVVEIFESRRGNRFYACLIPGRHPFWETVDTYKHIILSRKTIGDMRTLIEFRFKKKLEDWLPHNG